MRFCFFIAILFCCSLFSQKNVEFGTLSYSEKNFEIFEKDTAAAAVYLFEKGNNYFEVRNNFIYLITEYHAKIKILKKEGFEQANINIPFYHNEDRTEKVQHVKAITHNINSRTYVRADDIYNTDLNESWSQVAFTFPSVQIGSVLEYSYEVQSPFHFNLSGWEFQADIPKVYTEYNAKIPGNWSYNRLLIGEIPLNVNEASLKKDCFYIAGYGIADCEILKYVMKDVPAFDKTENFMLSRRNYNSKLEFELSEYHSFKGFTKKFTKSWNDVDKEFKTDRDLGRQLKKRNFLENNVPEDLLNSGNAISRAKAIYAFVKDHFTWNEKYGVWKNNRVKKAFEEKKGSVAEINMALINLLNSSNLKAEMMLLATRQRGLPKKAHPVMTDFDYVVAKLDIDGQSYLLDASDKEMPFGMLPFRCLNYYGRVMDFDNQSYWFDIAPEGKNDKQIRAEFELDVQNHIARGRFNLISMGYEAVSERNKVNSKSEEEYLEDFEKGIDSDFYITSYEVDKERSTEKMLVQKFEFEIENIFQNQTIYLNPNIVKFFGKNPFLASSRSYPIDFGYKRSYTLNLSFKIPEGYDVKSLPKERILALPGKDAVLRFKCVKVGEHSITVFFDLQLNGSHFKSGSYQAIKEIFQQAVDAQTKSYIVLERI
ncbi:MAG: DUF3857 domain-containing protein [Allomuricauda sp.]|nr:MAG: DUF3857 domain-containing protein [Allomuricauda sp.]